jgi:hypothetical protein
MKPVMRSPVEKSQWRPRPFLSSRQRRARVLQIQIDFANGILLFFGLIKCVMAGKTNKGELSWGAGQFPERFTVAGNSCFGGVISPLPI